MPEQFVCGVFRRRVQGVIGAPCDPYTDAHYKEDLRLARLHAHRLGLCDADCEDCAAEFVLSRLLRNRAGASDPTDAAWRHRCASNFAKNTLRSHVTRARRELPASDVLPWEAVSGDAPDPAADLMRRELWREVRRCCAEGLPTVPLQMFLRHYEDGESIQELAACYQEKPHAVEQKLFRARRRLRQLLAERGMDAAVLAGFLTPSEKVTFSKAEA